MKTIMNKKLLLIAMFLIVIPFVAAEEQVAFDGFESNTFTGGLGWNSNWVITGSANILSNANPYEGTRHLQLGGNSNVIVTRETSIANYNNIVLTVALRFQLQQNNGDIAQVVLIDENNNIQVLQSWTPAEFNTTGNCIVTILIKII